MRESLFLFLVSRVGALSNTRHGPIGAFSGGGDGATVLFEEWGALGSNKAELVWEFEKSLKEVGVSWLYWEVTKPGQGASNYEVYVGRGSPWGRRQHTLIV
jgi:hypothetical protein